MAGVLVLGLLSILGSGGGGGGSSPPPPALAITSQPASTTVGEGGTATFSVGVTGSAPFRYQWRRGGVEIGGATAASYAVTAATLADNGASFTVVVTDASGASVTSAAAVLTVTAAARVIIDTQPTAAPAVAGQSVTLTVVARAEPAAALTYQWLRGGQPISGATLASYTVGPLTLADNGAVLSVEVRAGNALATSNTVTLSVSAPSTATGNVAVSAANGYVLALATNGSVYGWGGAPYAGTSTPQAGNGARLLTVPVAAVDVSAGPTHALAVGVDGQLYGWGLAPAGQLGNRAPNTTLSNPALVDGVADLKQAIAVGSYSLMLKRDGTVWHWPGDTTNNAGTFTYAPRQAVSTAVVARLRPGSGLAGHAALAVLEDGRLAGVSIGLQAVGTTLRNTATLTPIAGWADVTDVACGTNHCIAATRAGGVLAAGDNGSGQLGQGDTRAVSGGPVAVAGVGNVVAVAAAGDTSFALSADGRVWVWGSDSGNGGPPFSGLRAAGSWPIVWPVEVAGLAGVRALGAASTIVVAIDGSGLPYSWSRLLSEFTLGGTTRTAVPFAAGGPRLAGSELAITTQPVPVVAGSGGSASFTVGTDNAGAAVQWLRNGGVIDGATRSTLVVDAVGAGDSGARFSAEVRFGSTVLRSAPAELTVAATALDLAVPGRVVGETLYEYGGGASATWTWGDGSPPASGARVDKRWALPGQYSASGPTSFAVTAVGAPLAVGFTHACAMRPDGTVACWGSNASGALGNGDAIDSPLPVVVAGLNDAVSVVAGYESSCALRSNAQVVCWGNNAFGQVGDGTGVERRTPTPVPGITDAVQIAAGQLFNCAALRSGRVKCWGSSGLSGSLGNGRSDNALSPSDVLNVVDAVSVSAGDFGACALRQTGEVVCWGSLVSGATGFGSSTPAAVAGITNATTVSAGASHACVLRQDRSVACWGNNANGQLGDGSAVSRTVPVTVTGLDRVMAIATGAGHTCALRLDRRLWCWGASVYIAAGTVADAGNNVPLARPVADLDGVAAIRSRGTLGCALKTNGAVVCWGSASQGQMGQGLLSADNRTPFTVRGPAFWR